MEEKGRESPAAPANAEAAPAEPPAEGSRRRAAAPKRKAPTGGSSSSSSTPSKRLAKERNQHPLPHHFHNGPVTRARQSPNKLAAAAPPQNPAERPGFVEVGTAAGRKEPEAAGDLAVGGDEELASAEEPVVDLEFEAVRSRASNVHVVPTHAGWFSWEKVHSLEERMMPSFFNGKTEKRTSDIYMEIRNSIMMKFHADPQTQIELKDLSELSVGDLEVRQEIMEFLDHWGLINFHPFPPSITDARALNMDREAKTPSLSEKFYQFEVIQPLVRLGPKTVDIAAPAVLPRLLQDSAIPEDLIRPQGPSVEYHCNSCSADCSRKRYHCQKQADFDLCTDCFNDGKFGSGMTPADFILMEPAEAPSASSGSWTDQETLLLLEALELYGENWNEIVEHVATKTKAQCILHFVQMPIEDAFREGTDEPDDSLPKNAGEGSKIKDLSVPDIPEKMDTEAAENGDRPVASPSSVSDKKDDSKAEVAQENGGTGASIAVDVLKTAFQTVGSLPEGGPISFADAGNPVMALAAFLVGLVEPDLVTTSTRSSLKAMSEDSPGIQLATRHCFPLEDPPNDRKHPPVSQSEEVQKEETQTPVMNGTDEQKSVTDKNDENAVSTNKEVSVSSKECTQKDTTKEVGKGSTPSIIKEPGDSSLRGAQTLQSDLKDSGDLCLLKDKAALNNQNDALASHGEDAPGKVKDSGESPSKEVAPSTKKKTNDLALAKDNQSNSVRDAGDATSLVKEFKQCSEASRAASVVSDPVTLNEKEHPQGTGSSSPVETKEPEGEDGSDLLLSNGKKKCNSDIVGGNHNMTKIKRAAVTALSAAAVNAKLLANQEEDQIHQLVALVIEKQMQKLETKLALFTEIESVIMRVREQLERARQRLYHERAQIIAARLGLPPSSSRATPSSLPTSKFAINYGFSGSRALNMGSQRPPIRRP